MQLKKKLAPFIYTGLMFTPSLYAYEYGDPSANEQAHLEAINRARMAPLTEASRLDIDLFEGVPPGEISAEPVQPLSFNASLTDTARAHSRDILFRNFFGHKNPDGESPFDRILAGGYLYRSAGENIAIYGTTGFLDLQSTALKLHDNLFVDKGYPNRGHRINILEPDFREIGIGLADGDWHHEGKIFNAQVVTTNFGLHQEDLPILLGVAYNDVNDDQHYQAGEGTADITVEILQSEDKTMTASAGGYGMELFPGDYLITFTDPDLGSIAKPFTVTDQNIKIDILSDEFANPGSLSQCAVLKEKHLLVPCLTDDTSHYVLDLNYEFTNQFEFTLNNYGVYPLTVTEQCARYDSQAQTVHFPCVTVNGQQFWADFQLTKQTPVTIELTDFGLL